MAMPALKLISLDEYLEREEKSDIRHEYHRGRVYAMSGGSYVHNKISINFLAALGKRINDRGCDVLLCEQRVHITKDDLYTYPDIVVVCGNPQLTPGGSPSLINPTIIVEVLSESTSGYDLGYKANFYRNIPSLTDYIVVWQDTPLIRHHTRGIGKTWITEDIEGLDAEIIIESINVTISLAEIFRNVRFPEYPTLRIVTD